MTPLQLEPSAHAPWTRTMFIRIDLRDRGTASEPDWTSSQLVGPTTAWMMVVNLVWVQPDRSPFHSAPIARTANRSPVGATTQNAAARDRQIWAAVQPAEPVEESRHEGSRSADR